MEAVLIDLSGTLHIEDTAVDGAVESLKALQKSKLKLKFVTNTTKECKRNLHERLTKLGFHIDIDDIFTSLTVARRYVEQHKLRPMLLLEETAKEDFEGIPQDDPNAVVIGLSPNSFNYEHLNQAFRLIKNGAPLVAVHKARYYQTKSGLSLGPGAFISGLEYACDTKAVVIGKPENEFYLSALEDLNCKPCKTFMIGDDVRDDIGGAQCAGLKGILVKTGKYREGDEGMIDPPPYKTVENFTAAVDHILEAFL